ncbi:transcription factor TFIIIB component B'' homolog [Actinia tenebrosa]|uniref:Transcription factor TFIIIB component B'' homolog n=1 Tax=Actinia tenebrosa TaxID=6105 RepID=A0A6P8JDJ1_ACTTE|nr:transcription factor TFIIIB component B'' homolog [Actinia tenebrosa]
MRNRFRPNVTPRSSRRSGPDRTISTSSTSCPSVSEPEQPQRGEETAVFIPPNSSRALVNTECPEVVLSAVEVTSTVQEPDESIPKATTTEIAKTTAKTRRPRIKPSVKPTARARKKPPTDAPKTVLQEANESASAAAEIEEVVATTTTSTTVDTAPSIDTSTINANNKQQPKPKPQSNTQAETSTEISKQTESSVSTSEGNQSSVGSSLTRRKRAIPNVGAAARRRSSVSVPKESTPDNRASQPESSVSQLIQEVSDKALPENDEVEERSNKRPRTASEPPLDNILGVAEVIVESVTATETQPVEEQVIEEDEEEATNKRVEEKKRKPRHSRPKEPLDPSKMTLQDLIYFNPKDNPMKSSVDAKRRKIGNKRKPSQSNESENGDANAIEVDGQDATDQASTTTEQTAEPSTDTPTPQEGDEDRVHAPQVKIGADGCIILDEESLLIKSPPNSTLQERDIVYEDSNNLNYAAFFKQPKRTKWSMPETLKFYKALSQVGTDFSLMMPLFPKRRRRELKAKFKREEKVHQDLVDRALVHRTPITIEMFQRPDKPEEDILDDDDSNISTAK